MMETVLHVLDTDNNRTAQERDCRRRRVSLLLIPSLRNFLHSLLVLDDWRKPATLSSSALSLAALVATVLITMLALVLVALLATPYRVLSRHKVCWRSEVIPLLAMATVTSVALSTAPSSTIMLSTARTTTTVMPETPMTFSVSRQSF